MQGSFSDNLAFILETLKNGKFLIQIYECIIYDLKVVNENLVGLCRLSSLK